MCRSCESRSSDSVPMMTWCPPTVAMTPRPATAVKSPTGRVAAPANATTAFASGCSDIASTAPMAASTSCRSRPGTISESTTTGRPSVSVPVLSNTTVSTPASFSSGSPPLISTPAAAPRPLATITAVGTARPIAHGQAMISTAIAAVSADANDGSAGTSIQTANVTIAIEHDRRYEHRRDPVRQSLNRRLRALGLLHQRHDPRQHARRANAGRLELERSRRVDGGANDAIARRLLDRNRFAGEHRFVHGAAAKRDDAVDGNALAGANDDDVAGADVGDCHVDELIVTADARGRRLELGELTQRASRVALCASFHRVAEQHQRDDDDDRFVIDIGSGAVDGEELRREQWPPPNTGRRRRCRPRSAYSCRRSHAAGPSMPARKSGVPPRPSQRSSWPAAVTATSARSRRTAKGPGVSSADRAPASSRRSADQANARRVSCRLRPSAASTPPWRTPRG